MISDDVRHEKNHATSSEIEVISHPTRQSVDLGCFFVKNSSKMLDVFHIRLRFSRNFLQKINSSSSVLPRQRMWQPITN